MNRIASADSAVCCVSPRSFLSDHHLTNQRLDATAARLDYGARRYDSYLGRLISLDTIVPDPANPQSLNRYAYVGNNPLKYVDPMGHAACAAGDRQCWTTEWNWKNRWYNVQDVQVHIRNALDLQVQVDRIQALLKGW
jgi:RHS repeat-associated protein